jgi:hypothetical protein
LRVGPLAEADEALSCRCALIRKAEDQQHGSVAQRPAGGGKARTAGAGDDDRAAFDLDEPAGFEFS